MTDPDSPDRPASDRSAGDLFQVIDVAPLPPTERAETRMTGFAPVAHLGPRRDLTALVPARTTAAVLVPVARLAPVPDSAPAVDGDDLAPACARCGTAVTDRQSRLWSFPVDGSGVCQACAGSEAVRSRGRILDELDARTYKVRRAVWQGILWHLPTIAAALVLACVAAVAGLAAHLTGVQLPILLLVPAGVVVGAAIRPGPRPARVTARHRANPDTPARTIVPARTTDTTRHRATTGS